MTKVPFKIDMRDGPDILAKKTAMAMCSLANSDASANNTFYPSSTSDVIFDSPSKKVLIGGSGSVTFFISEDEQEIQLTGLTSGTVIEFPFYGISSTTVNLVVSI